MLTLCIAFAHTEGVVVSNTLLHPAAACATPVGTLLTPVYTHMLTVILLYEMFVKPIGVGFAALKYCVLAQTTPQSTGTDAARQPRALDSWRAFIRMWCFARDFHPVQQLVQLTTWACLRCCIRVQ